MFRPKSLIFISELTPTVSNCLRRRCSGFLLVLVVVLSFARLSVADEGKDLIRATLLNASAFRNYEVSIHHWQSLTEREPSKPRFEDLETTIKSRLVIDYDQPRMFEVRRTTYSRDPSVPDSRRPQHENPLVSLECFAWQDGKAEHIIVNVHTRNTDIEFGKFTKGIRVPLVGFCTIGPYAPYSPAHPDEIRDNLIKFIDRDPDSKMILLPDGTRSIYFSNDSESHAYGFDPRFIPPVSETWIVQRGGKPHITDEKKTVYDEASGVFRPITIQYDRDAGGLVSADPKAEDAKLFEVNTVEFKYRQFNEEKLVFPDIDQLKKSAVTLNQYLDAE